MTIEEFNGTLWSVGMKVEILSGVFKGRVYDVMSPDFDQQLIGVNAYNDNDCELTWFRCENCKIVHSNTPQ